MATSRNRLVSTILLVTAAATGLIGLYFLLVREDTRLGAILLVVAVSDLGMAMVFARKG